MFSNSYQFDLHNKLVLHQILPLLYYNEWAAYLI